jgi:tetratricopeptide (TPR) repeat protein
VAVGISVPEDKPEELPSKEMLVDSVAGKLPDGPVLMNAIRDSETGEMVATDVISASKVTARFRNVPERAGYVSIGFDVNVPSALSRSAWKLELCPMMAIQGDTLPLRPIHVTGQAYREAQLKGYQRYGRFIESIISDPKYFVRLGQLEIFLERYFPETYAMKTDSSFVSEPLAENLFGVTQREALLHYKKKWKEKINEKRKSDRDRMYNKYVRDPIKQDGLMLDTVLTAGNGFVYRYTHRFRSRPGLKKVQVYLEGDLYEKGEPILPFPKSDDMTFYISSLSSLADPTPKYRMVVLERTVYDNTKALIDFAQGSSSIDTLLGDNASELMRVKRCIADVSAHDELVLDSLVISASCSPEGDYWYNTRLALARSRSVCDYVSGYVPPEWKERLRIDCVPENWEQFRLLVSHDSLIDRKVQRRLLDLTEDLSRPDDVERKIASMSQYRYLREKVYPKLRSVKFDFYLHRAGMVKDTVHTTEIDTLYMSGVEALRNLDYKRAVSILRPYGDYNSALAFMSAEYNHSALDVLQKLDEEDAKVCYLMAVVLSRMEQKEMAEAYFRRALLYDPYLQHRANLDPEMSVFVKSLNDDQL